MRATCSRSTSRHSSATNSSVISSAASSPRVTPSTSSMINITELSGASSTRWTRGAWTPARSAIIPASAWCSTACLSEAAGRTSPTSRRRTKRYPRYSRSASRWSCPRILTNARAPSTVSTTKPRAPLPCTGATSTCTAGYPRPVSAARTSAGPGRRSGVPKASSTPVPTAAPTMNAMNSHIGRTVPATSRAAATSASPTQVARRHAGSSQRVSVTAAATPPARNGGLGNEALPNQPSLARLDDSVDGGDRSTTVSTAHINTAAKTAAPSSVANSRNRRRRSTAIGTATTATRTSNWTTPTSRRPAAVRGGTPVT